MGFLSNRDARRKRLYFSFLPTFIFESLLLPSRQKITYKMSEIFKWERSKFMPLATSRLTRMPVYPCLGNPDAGLAPECSSFSKKWNFKSFPF